MKSQTLLTLRVTITAIVCGTLGGLLGSLLVAYFILK